MYFVHTKHTVRAKFIVSCCFFLLSLSPFERFISTAFLAGEFLYDFTVARWVA